MTKEKAIKESIAHWERMIKWAKNEVESKTASAYVMLNILGETYHEDDCPLCKKYSNYMNEYCGPCPLKNKFGRYENRYNVVYLCIEQYHVTEQSGTWGEWVVNAKKMLKDLRSLLKKKVNK